MLDAKTLHSIPRQSAYLSTPTNTSQYSSLSKALAVKEISTDTKFSLFSGAKKPSLDTASNGSNSTTSSISNMATIKTDFQTKEKNYQNTIEKLQKKIEALSLENRKLSESISTKNSCLIAGKSEDGVSCGEEREREKNERTLQSKINSLAEENANLLQQVSAKNREINNLERKLGEFIKKETPQPSQDLLRITKENELLQTKLSEKEKKYEELEEMYKQKLSQFKRELLFIKGQQKEPSPMDSLSQMSHRIKELEETVKSKNDELSSLKKNEPKTPHCNETPPVFNQKNASNKEFSSGILRRDASKTGLVRCNWEELEKKLNRLVEENEKLSENGGEAFWQGKYRELCEKIGGDGKEGFNKVLMENEELRRKVKEMGGEKENMMNFVQVEAENKIRSLKENFRKQEEEMKNNYESTISKLEEQKEKNLMKISKENHELKQHNDELKQQIETLQKGMQSSPLAENFNSNTHKRTNEIKQTTLPNSSPILIINEMMTPSAKNLLEKTHGKGENSKNYTNNTIAENKDENNFAFNKIKKISNENVKKNLLNSANVSNPSNSELGRGLTVAKSHNPRESQEFSARFIAKNYIVPNSNNSQNNNSMKESSKEVSFKENNLKESNVSFKDSVENVPQNKSINDRNEINQQKQSNYLHTGKHDLLKKETKVISFNLLDNNKGKNEANNHILGHNNISNNNNATLISARITKV